MHVKSFRTLATLYAVSSTLALTSIASAQWTVTNLHPQGATGYSDAWAASGDQQFGSVAMNGPHRASMWSGTAASRVDLHPAGLFNSLIMGAGGGQQVGVVRLFSGTRIASIWTGTAESWVSLAPAGVWGGSRARDTDGVQQVGEVDDVSLRFSLASLWTGTAESWVNLNPAGATGSMARGVGGGQQVGSASFGDGLARACLWTGTAESWVDLHPAGATESSAWAVSGDQQVGSASVGGVTVASLWRGTATSWVNLRPPGAGNSWANDVHGGLQVGSGYFHVSQQRAILWRGTADSWVDLHAFLPPEYSYSYALGISSDGINTYVVGTGHNTITRRNEALLWTGPLLTPCTADFDGDGFIDFFDLAAFVDCFEGGACPPGKTADFDADGFVDLLDYTAFITAFETGC